MLEIVRPSQKSCDAEMTPVISPSSTPASASAARDRLPGELRRVRVVAARRVCGLADADHVRGGCSRHLRFLPNVRQNATSGCSRLRAVDLSWSPEQQELRALAREFAEREIAPQVADYDREERFPIELVRQAAALGFAGGIVPAEYGGAGLDHVTYAGLIEEISRTCHIVACALTFPSGLVGNSILTYGTEEQKQRYLAPLARGETFAGAGRDRGALRAPTSSDMDTMARRDGGDFVISGAKMWISFLDVASLLPHLRPPRGGRAQRAQADLRVPRRRRPRRASRPIRSRTSTASARSRPASSSSRTSACRPTRCSGRRGRASRSR